MFARPLLFLGNGLILVAGAVAMDAAVPAAAEDDAVQRRVREVVLKSAHHWDAKSHIDFDTGRVYEYLEQFEPPDDLNKVQFGVQIQAWYRQHGIDARSYGSVEGQDLFVWLVDDNRWETLEDEIRAGGELKVPRAGDRRGKLCLVGTRGSHQWSAAASA